MHIDGEAEDIPWWSKKHNHQETELRQSAEETGQEEGYPQES
jgi:hypothetical protein